MRLESTKKRVTYTFKVNSAKYDYGLHPQGNPNSSQTSYEVHIIFVDDVFDAYVLDFSFKNHKTQLEFLSDLHIEAVKIADAITKEKV